MDGEDEKLIMYRCDFRQAVSVEFAHKKTEGKREFVKIKVGDRGGGRAVAG